ncbi:MAG TPA: ABC transporter ATP-binding protein [Streptosporangiaceae bacterium]|nr:ABC transporter ATP-binding protein [Streptosporangiaceae bacterium]
MTSLAVEGLTKSFRDVAVLRGVDLHIEPGSLTAILGASGAGKTTLLRVIAGFEAADQGRVSLDGTVVDDGRRRLPPERRRIGYVPQDGALFPHLTVRANAAFSLPRRERQGDRADEILRLVGLAGLGHRFPHELSGGQQQRVAIARALASRPALVLLDEPFASLDAALRSSVRAEVLEVLRSTGTTAVLVTHDQDEALSAADYVAVMRDGRITQTGPPREVYQRPADPWTATFVGTANLLPGGRTGAGQVRTALGSHRLYAEPGGGPDAPGPGPADVTVLVRPEQIRLLPPGPGTLAARVCAARYHGHDALVTVRPDAAARGDEVLHIRIIGSDLPSPGERVGLEVHGPVVAWPAQAVPAQAAAAVPDAAVVPEAAAVTDDPAAAHNGAAPRSELRRAAEGN